MKAHLRTKAETRFSNLQYHSLWDGCKSIHMRVFVVCPDGGLCGYAWFFSPHGDVTIGPSLQRNVSPFGMWWVVLGGDADADTR